jgi:hypothetical protein
VADEAQRWCGCWPISEDDPEAPLAQCHLVVTAERTFHDAPDLGGLRARSTIGIEVGNSARDTAETVLSERNGNSSQFEHRCTHVGAS